MRRLAISVLLLCLPSLGCGSETSSLRPAADAAVTQAADSGSVQGGADAGSVQGGADARPVQGGIARVEIAPVSVFLTAAGQTRLLAARAFDEQGAEVAATFAWTSSRPDDVAVDGEGRLLAKRIGSAQLFAEAGGVRSPPALVVVAQPVAGAVLVSDAQVVAVDAPVLQAGQVPGVGTRYDVRLTGVSPAPAAGTVMLASETAPVAGRVVSTREESGTLVVTLELAPLYEVLSAYHLDWSIDLSPYGATVVSDAKPRAPEDGPIQPFRALKCDGQLEAKLFKKMITLAIDNELNLEIKDDRDPGTAPGYSKLALTGSLTLSGTVEVGLNANISLTGTCEAQVKINMPIFGWVSVLVMPALRLGAGVELTGKLTVATGTLGVTGKVGLSAQFGWECGPSPVPCHNLPPAPGTTGSVNPINELKPKVEIPSIHGMRVDLSGQFYVLVGLDLAFLGGAGGHFAIAEAKIGPKQSGKSMAFEDDQAHEAALRSSYDLELTASLEPGSGLKAAIKKVIDDDAVGVTLKSEFKKVLSESPRGTFTVDKMRVGLGKKVKLTVDLDPMTVNYFLLDYNVDSIRFRRLADGGESYEEVPELTIPIRASNQTHFEVEWTPKESDAGKNDFAAFVRTTLPILPDLEIADDSRKQIEVLAFCPAAKVAFSRPATGCGGTMKHVLTTNLPGIGSTTETITAQVRLVRETSNPDAPLVVLRPTGSFTYDRTGTVGICTLRIAPTSGDLPAPPYAGALFVYTESEPFLYDGAVATGEFTVSQVVTCPEGSFTTEIPSWDFDLFMVDVDAKFQLGADGKTMHGSFTEVTETTTDTWEWDLMLE